MTFKSVYELKEKEKLEKSKIYSNLLNFNF